MASKTYDSLVCLDIGGDSIKAAEFSYDASGAVTLQKFSLTETGLNELSTDDPAFQPALQDKVRTLLLSEGFSSKNVNVSLSGQNAFIRFDKIPAMTNDMVKVRQILDFEAKQNLPFPVQDIVYDTQLIQANEEDELEAMFVVAKRSEVEGVMTNLEGIQKKVNAIEVAPTAAYNAAHFCGVGENQCEMILNIGGHSSTLIFLDNGKFFIRTFLTAGHTITQQICKEFQVSYKDAEEMKRRHGFVGLGGAYEDPESEVAATVSKIIRNVMTRLHGEIFRTINVYRNQQKGRKPEKLYLTGGSSVMAYTPRFFQEKLRIPVEYLNPFQSVNVGPAVDREALASVAHVFPEVVGLAMRNAYQCPLSIALIPHFRRKQADFMQKVPYFYASCIALIFCLGVTYWTLLTRFDTEQVLSSEAESKKKGTQKIQKEVEEYHGRLQTDISSYKEAAQYLKDSDFWTKFLSAIERVTPPEVWYTSIRPVTDVKNELPQAQQQAGPPEGGFSGFGGFGDVSSSDSSDANAGAAPGKRDTSKLQWVILEGNILTQKAEELNRANDIYRRLKASLAALDLEPPAKRGDPPGRPLFEKPDQVSSNRMDVNFQVAPVGANISTFKYEFKLKTPISR